MQQHGRPCLECCIDDLALQRAELSQRKHAAQQLLHRGILCGWEAAGGRAWCGLPCTESGAAGPTPVGETNPSLPACAGRCCRTSMHQRAAEAWTVCDAQCRAQPAQAAHPGEGACPVGARRPPLHGHGARETLPLRLQRRLPCQQRLHLVLHLRKCRWWPRPQAVGLWLSIKGMQRHERQEAPGANFRQQRRQAPNSPGPAPIPPPAAAGPIRHCRRPHWARARPPGGPPGPWSFRRPACRLSTTVWTAQSTPAMRSALPRGPPRLHWLVKCGGRPGLACGAFAAVCAHPVKRSGRSGPCARCPQPRKLELALRSQLRRPPRWHVQKRATTR